MDANNTVLVLGATGGIGSEVAGELRHAGWKVRAMSRNAAGSADGTSGVQWVGGDALVPSDVMKAAQGCTAIVHAVNPPGYKRWSELVLPMLDNTIAAAQAVGATVVLPGTVYNYGPDAFPVLDESSMQNPLTRKGLIRVQMERRLQDVAEAGPMRVIIVRAGDFFGPKTGNSWFTQGIVKPGRPLSTAYLPGAPGVGHQYSYLPDVARTMVKLLTLGAKLPRFASFHMAGHWDEDGRQFGEAIRRAAVRRGYPAPEIKPFRWWLIRLASPFVETLRELLEMRYLWNEEVRMSNRRLVDVLGAEPHTPLDEAVETALQGIGCFGQTTSPIANPLTGNAP